MITSVFHNTLQAIVLLVLLATIAIAAAAAATDVASALALVTTPLSSPITALQKSTYYSHQGHFVRPPSPRPPSSELWAKNKKKSNNKRRSNANRSATSTNAGGRGFGSSRSSSSSAPSLISSSASAIVAAEVHADDDDEVYLSSSILGAAATAAAAVAATDATTTNNPNSSSSSVHANLLTWLTRPPNNAYVSPKFIIRPSPLGGCGGFVVSSSSPSSSSSSSSLRKNELILRIPRRECCVTHDDALFDADCGASFRDIARERRPGWEMVLIAGWIAKEYLLACEYADSNAASSTTAAATTPAATNRMIKHSPYLQSIPWSRGTLGQDHVLFWSNDEVETLLEGSMAYDDAILIRNTVDRAVESLSDFVVPVVRSVRKELRRNDDRGGSTSRRITTTVGEEENDEADIRERLERAVRGAFAITLSRSFAEEVESSDRSVVEVENVLLPLIDVLQHSNNPNTYLESYDEYVSLRAARDVSAGEELFHRYREEDDDVIPPHKFFTRYGFVPGVRVPVEELLRGKSGLFFDDGESEEESGGGGGGV